MTLSEQADVKCGGQGNNAVSVFIVYVSKTLIYLSLELFCFFSLVLKAMYNSLEMEGKYLMA